MYAFLKTSSFLEGAPCQMGKTESRMGESCLNCWLLGIWDALHPMFRYIFFEKGIEGSATDNVAASSSCGYCVRVQLANELDTRGR